MNTPQEIWQAMLASKNPVLCIDSRFDYDAFGSSIALREVLKEHGVNLRLTYADKAPDYSKEYIDIVDIEEEVEPSEVDFSKHDLFITLDSANYEHVSKTREFSKPAGIKTLKIDHHSSSEPEADLNYIRVASSTCRLIWEIFNENDISISSEIAYLLAIGHLTDTGFLKYEGVNSDDYRMIAGLMDIGVDMYSLRWKMDFNNTLDNAKFVQLIYKNLVIDNEKKVAYSHYTLQDIQDHKINMNDVYLKGADLIKTFKGIDFAFVVKENSSQTGIYDVSFRSRLPEVSVLEFAEKFDGGGHRMAAACKINADSIQSALATILESQIFIRS